MARDGEGMNNPLGILGLAGSPLDGVTKNQVLMLAQLSAIVQALNGIFRNMGAFTWGAAAATSTVTNTAIQSTSRVVLVPINAAAATLVGSNESPYVSSISAGVSFTVSTAAGTAAAGTEEFFYLVITPV